MNSRIMAVLIPMIFLAAVLVGGDVAKVEGKLAVNGKEFKLTSVCSRTQDNFGKKDVVVILTEKPVPPAALKEDKLYQLAYSKEVQGIRMRFNDKKELIGVIVYHPAFDGPSVEYQGSANFEKTRFDEAMVEGKISMDMKDTDGKTIVFTATFQSPIPAE